MAPSYAAAASAASHAHRAQRHHVAAASNGHHHPPQHAYASQQQSSSLALSSSLLQPPPKSYVLCAVLRCVTAPPLQAGQIVYLLPTAWLQNWCTWAQHQPMSPSERGRLQPALQLAAERLNLSFEVDSKDYTNPGPLDARPLSVPGHVLLLRPTVHISTTKQQKPQMVHRARSLSAVVDPAAAQQQPGGSAVSDDQDGCRAVPEAFYETLRRVHGVLCDDGSTVSFQPPPVPSAGIVPGQAGRGGRSLCWLWHDNRTVNGHGNSSTPPRPIEFQRPVINAAMDDQDKESEGAAATQNKAQNNATTTAATDPTVSLMDKLLLEEELLASPERAAAKVEVHPIRLHYNVVVGMDSAGEADTNLSGMILVSRQAPVQDAVKALIRIVQPSKAVQCVRLWCKAHYTSPAEQQVPPTRSVRGDGFELMNPDLLVTRQADQTLRSWTVAEWIERYSCLSRHPEKKCGAREDDDPNSQHLSPHVDILLETRKTLNSDWPRANLELTSRLRRGDFVDAQDVSGKWYEAVVRDIDAENRSITVHYAGWASRWDAKLRLRDTADSESGKIDVSGPNLLPSPAPLWSRTRRWREKLRPGDRLEVRDSSSLAHRPKWYTGEVKQVGQPTDTPRDLTGGADVEVYSWGVADDTAASDGCQKKEPILLLDRTQQILVQVDQEKTDKASVDGIPTSPGEGDLAAGLNPQPPFLRWVNLYGEEICRLGTHLKQENDPQNQQGPATLHYELDAQRKPVEIMKGHPMHGAGFVRESLRGTPPAPGLVGLHNLGNSCFLNATVQCVYHSMKPLTQFFLKDMYTADLNEKNPLGSGGNVATAYASLLKKMWGGEYSTLVPRLLKQTVAAFAPQFDNSYQHDCQEFCQFLMDGLHEDLNRVTNKPYVEELEGFGMQDKHAAIESWRKHLLRHDSVIVEHCQGMHRSHITCPQCGRESIKFDVYSSISLPLDIGKDPTTLRLEDCIEKFMEGEQLDEKNAWYCPSCRKHVCALKMIALWTVPDVLILHLKRFTFDTCMTSGGMLRSKIDCKVDFPIEGLDMSKHVLGPTDPDAPPVYRLFGVSEHSGMTATSGHYTATVRNSVDGQWYRCNDSHVGVTSGEASITGGAYLLFYQRTKGVSKWAGMDKLMKDMKIDPYGGLNADIEGFTKVKSKKRDKDKRSR